MRSSRASCRPRRGRIPPPRRPGGDREPCSGRRDGPGRADSSRLVGRQAVAVHFGDETKIIRQGEVPDIERNGQLQFLVARIQRQHAAVLAGSGIVRHVDLDVDAAILGPGRVVRGGHGQPVGQRDNGVWQRSLFRLRYGAVAAESRLIVLSLHWRPNVHRRPDALNGAMHQHLEADELIASRVEAYFLSSRLQRNEAQTRTARGASKQAAEKFDASLLFC